MKQDDQASRGIDSLRAHLIRRIRQYEVSDERQDGAPIAEDAASEAILTAALDHDARMRRALDGLSEHEEAIKRLGALADRHQVARDALLDAYRPQYPGASIQ